VVQPLDGQFQYDGEPLTWTRAAICRRVVSAAAHEAYGRISRALASRSAVAGPALRAWWAVT
jgi:hypothetical protein